jgi:hypothetical protein
MGLGEAVAGLGRVVVSRSPAGQTPPELTGDVARPNSLAGGSTLLRGFSTSLAGETGLPVSRRWELAADLSCDRGLEKPSIILRSSAHRAERRTSARRRSARSAPCDVS